MLVRSIWSSRQLFNLRAFRFLEFTGSISLCIRSTVERLKRCLGLQSSRSSTPRVKASWGGWLSLWINFVLPDPDAPAMTITWRASFPFPLAFIGSSSCNLYDRWCLLFRGTSLPEWWQYFVGSCWFLGGRWRSVEVIELFLIGLAGKCLAWSEKTCLVNINVSFSHMKSLVEELESN